MVQGDLFVERYETYSDNELLALAYGAITNVEYSDLVEYTKELVKRFIRAKNEAEHYKFMYESLSE